MQPDSAGLQVTPRLSLENLDPRLRDHGPEPYCRTHTYGKATGEQEDKIISTDSEAYISHKEALNHDNVISNDDAIRGSRLVCGMRRKVFWAIVVAASVISIAAILGGVLGVYTTRRDGFSSNSSSSPPSSPQNSGASSTTSATKTTNTPTSTTTIALPNKTLLRDCPSSNGTERTVQLGVTSFTFLKACETSFDFNKSTKENFINVPTTSLDDCIARCAQFNLNDHKTSTGLSQSCSSVCWTNASQNGGLQGQCYGFALDMPAGKVPVGRKEVSCDSAVWINIPSVTT